MSARVRRARRGYTIIEVMMALTVLALLGSTVVMLQKVTLLGNNHARSLAVANSVAATWVERLRTDALMWNSPPNLPDDLSDTKWLKSAGAGWFIPAEVAYKATTPAGSPDADILGNDLFAKDKKAVPYCTQLRLTKMGPYAKVIRAEIRVSWNSGVANIDCTSPSAAATHTGSITVVTNIAQNSAP